QETWLTGEQARALLGLGGLAVALERSRGEPVEIEGGAEAAKRPDHPGSAEVEHAPLRRLDLVVELVHRPDAAVERRLGVGDDGGDRTADGRLVPRHDRMAHKTFARLGTAYTFSGN